MPTGVVLVMYEEISAMLTIAWLQLLPKRDDAGVSCLLGDLHHLHRVLRRVESELSFLFEPRSSDSDRQFRAGRSGQNTGMRLLKADVMIPSSWAISDSSRPIRCRNSRTE